MKKTLLFLIMLSLTSCDFDKGFEKKQKEDRDDINVIDKFGAQGLDKAIKLFDTRTRVS